MEELLIAAATALAGRVADTLTADGLKALDSLRKAVAAKFSRRPALGKTLESAQEKPDDQARIKALANALGMAAGTDQEFARTISALVPQFALYATDNSTNVALTSGPISGGTNIQTGIVHGNFTINQGGDGEEG